MIRRDLIEALNEAGLQQIKGTNLFTTEAQERVARVAYFDLGRGSFMPVFGYWLTQIEAEAWQLVEKARVIAYPDSAKDGNAGKIMLLRLLDSQEYKQSRGELQWWSLRDQVMFAKNYLADLQPLADEEQYFKFCQGLDELGWRLTAVFGVIVSWMLYDYRRAGVLDLSRMPTEFRHAFDHQWRRVAWREKLIDAAYSLVKNERA